MNSKKHLWLAVAILVFASAGQASAGPNANAVVSLDLIAGGGAGNRTDDGITSGVETLVTTGLVTPRGIALDVAGGKMYWTDSVVDADKIQRSNLDGSVDGSLEGIRSSGKCSEK